MQKDHASFFRMQQLVGETKRHGNRAGRRLPSSQRDGNQEEASIYVMSQVELFTAASFITAMFINKSYLLFLFYTKNQKIVLLFM